LVALGDGLEESEGSDVVHVQLLSELILEGKSGELSWRSVGNRENNTPLQRTNRPHGQRGQKAMLVAYDLLSRLPLLIGTLIFSVHCSGQSQFPEPYTFVTIAGRYETGNPGYPVGGYADGTGTNALFSFPSGVAVDDSGNLYVTDSYNSVIRRITAVVAGRATNWVVTTLAGQVQIGPGGYPVGGYADGTGTNALFNWPVGIAVDGGGRIFVTDSQNNVVRMVTPTSTPDLGTTNWVVTTIAGQPGISGDQDGTNNEASFSVPTGIAITRDGDLLLCDNNPGLLRRLRLEGTNWVVTTLAGGGTASFDPENVLGNGLGTNAQLGFLYGLAVGQEGSVVLADAGYNAIRKVSRVGSDWLVTTLAGAGPYSWGYGDGPRSFALFDSPSGVGVDGQGNVIVADTVNAAVRKVTREGIVSTVAGRQVGWTDGTGTNVAFRSPFGIASDSQGRVFLVERLNGVVRMGWPYEPPPDPENYGHPEFTVQPQDQTVTGTYDAVFRVAITNAMPVGYQWRKNGLDIPGATNAPLVISNVCPQDAGAYQVVVFYTPGNHPHPHPLAVVSSQAVLTVTVPLTFTSLAGWLEPGYSNAIGSQAMFHLPSGMAVDNAGTVYVADYENSVVRTITRAGVVSTLTGWEVDGPGVPIGGRPAQFYEPIGLAGDAAGNLYLASLDNTIRKLTWMGTNWHVSMIAGAHDIYGSADGMGSLARFSQPFAIASDPSTNLYVTDVGNSTIRKLTPVGTDWYVSTLAGTPGISGVNDGTNGDAQFTFPRGIAVDALGNVFVADLGNQAIRRVTPAGVVTTIAGSRANIGSADGFGNVAQFLYPSWVAADHPGTVYVADHYNSAIRKLTQVGTNWLVTTVAGLSGHEGHADGTGSRAQFVFPNSMALDGLGNLYVADEFNIIRKGWAADVSPVIVMEQPIMTGQEVRLDFTLATGAADSFALMQSGLPSGPWTTAPAALTTNVPGLSFRFAAPLTESGDRYFRVRAP
jgi:sugar lactone lactonase YvrE